MVRVSGLLNNICLVAALGKIKKKMRIERTLELFGVLGPYKEIDQDQNAHTSLQFKLGDYEERVIDTLRYNSYCI